jgi:integrating conjugative element protein (TIGR03749 family)
MLLLLLLPGIGRAFELMKWERIPLQVPLTVGQERIVFVDKNVRVGFPPALSERLRIQSSGGAVYLDAKTAFPVTRLQLQNKENGEIILLDVSASEGKVMREPVRIVYGDDVQNSDIPATSSEENEGASPSARKNMHKSRTQKAESLPLNTPLPVLLTRYAAQSLYAPQRTVEPVPGIVPVSLRLPDTLSMLLPLEPVEVRPLAAWQLMSSSVVALQIRNRSSGTVVLDPREVTGRFIAATFQHRWLGKAGSPEDTTVLYLVTEGHPNTAFIDEPRQAIPGTRRREKQ